MFYLRSLLRLDISSSSGCTLCLRNWFFYCFLCKVNLNKGLGSASDFNLKCLSIIAKYPDANISCLKSPKVFCRNLFFLYCPAIRFFVICETFSIKEFEWVSYEMIHPKFLFKKATEPYLYNESILSDKKESLHLSVRANVHIVRTFLDRKCRRHLLIRKPIFAGVNNLV